METYVSLRGYKHGEIGRNHFQKDQNGLSEKSTLTEIAKELNMSVSNLKRALRIEHNLTDSMKELLDIINKIKYRSPRNKTTNVQ